MKQDNVVQTKSYAFALRIVKLYQYFVKEKQEYVLSKQLLRSGTSIGANVEEAIGGQSQKDFQAKLAISYKEARETHYWLRLMRDSGYLSGMQSESLLADCSELLKILGSIQRTMKKHNS
ncbi:MAG: four helix bundle protein [Candidatus Marinimicrobia bacterium]|nr:four helix bundle protein [Candidatus Neomarinimicrobiota bacterium]